jgi:transcriptional regulator with XRE-family HTH domain
MSEEIDFANLPDFPKRVGEKLKTIRKRLNLSPDQIAPLVGAKSGAEILSYEIGEEDLPVSVLWAYARLAGNPMMNLIEDDLEVNWSNN